MAKKAKQPDETPQCYICERHLHGRYEMDHFPVPQSDGGRHVLPICVACHDDKDRTPLEKYDFTMAFVAMAGLWSRASRNERLMLVKMFAVAGQLHATMKGKAKR